MRRPSFTASPPNNLDGPDFRHQTIDRLLAYVIRDNYGPASAERLLASGHVPGRPLIGLRALRADDADVLCRIHREPQVARWWGHPDPGFPHADFPEAERFVVERDGVVLGMVEVCEENEPRYRHAAVDIFLDPACHGQGVGAEALRLVLATLVDRGHHRVTIDPAAANAAAIRAYEKAGFTAVGVMRRYEREPFGPAWHDGLLMEYLAEPSQP